MLPMRIGWLKLHYLWAYAINGSILPYLSLYGKQRGLSDAQVGWVYGSYGLAVLVAPPMYTALADRFSNNRVLIALSYALSAAAVAGLCFSESFMFILLTYVLFALCFTATIPLLDGLTFATIDAPVDEALGPGPGPVRTPYRAIRVFGSYGWMVPGLAFPLLLLRGYDTLTVCLIAIFTGAGFAMLGALTASGLPRHAPRKKLERSLPTLVALGAMRQRPVAVLVVSLFLIFVSITSYYAFYPPYMELLGVKPELIGLITNIGVAVEIGLMAASNWLLRRIGVRGVLLFGAVAHVLRMGLLAGVPNATVAIASQILHGPTVLTLYLIPPMYLNAKAEPEYRNSMQGLYAMLCYGVARLVGSFLGHVSEAAGGGMAGLTAVFWTAAAIGLAGLLLMAFGFFDAPTSRKLEDQPPAG